MFTNKAGCTIYEKTTVNRATAYVRHITGSVYWQPSVGESDGKDRNEQNSIFVSIPAASADYLPNEGDRITGDIITDEQPPESAYTIANVKDLRYGSPKVQHIELTVK